MPGASSGSNNGNPTGIVELAKKGTGTQYSFTQSYAYDSLNRLNVASDSDVPGLDTEFQLRPVRQSMDADFRESDHRFHLKPISVFIPGDQNVTSVFGYDQNDNRPSCFGGFVHDTIWNFVPQFPGMSTAAEEGTNIPQAVFRSGITVTSDAFQL